LAKNDFSAKLGATRVGSALTQQSIRESGLQGELIKHANGSLLGEIREEDRTHMVWELEKPFAEQPRR